MKKEDIDTVIETIITTISQALRKNGAEIMKAYKMMVDDGVLPVSCGIKMQGNLEQIKTIINLSFPIEKFKECYKQTIEVKQGTLFPIYTETGKKEKAGEEQETRPLAGDTSADSDQPDAPTDQLPVPTHNIKAGKDISIKVGELQDGPVWKWFAELNFPPGGQAYDGAYDSQETFKTRDAAGQAGLTFAIGQLDAAVAKNVFAPSAKARINKGRSLMVHELGGKDPAPV